ncbi:MAG: hypothetical protein COC05_02260 [Gammaproteobacteria bacterium]|nr:MAG: hypothetical protein COC05_02260 [Gammaproteobacteria bacterium]
MPLLRQWYRDLEREQLFSLVAIDGESGTIELQYFDDEVEELDVSGWDSLVLEMAKAPEDWTGPYDEIEEDDPGYTDDDKHSALS